MHSPLTLSQVVREDAASPVFGDYFTRGPRFHRLAQIISSSTTRRLLVIGCGNGYLETILDSRLVTLSIDINSTHLERARSANAGNPNRGFRHMDLYDLTTTVPAGAFDGVVVSEVLEHLDDDSRALEMVRHCLTPGGTFFLMVPNLLRFQNRLRRSPCFMASDHLREYTLETVTALVEKTGFSVRHHEGVDFWLPKDHLWQTLFPIGNPVRRWISARWPRIATWFLLVCQSRPT